MPKFSMYNPLKNQNITDIHHMLLNFVHQANKEVCFYNDNIGFYFSPLRSCENVSLWLDDYRYYNLYCMLKNDLYLTRIMFKELCAGFHWELIEHFEERKETEKNPVVVSWILFYLHNISDAQDNSFSQYNKLLCDGIVDKVNALDKYYIGNKKIYHIEKPKDAFIISVEKEFKGYEGLLITKSKKPKLELVQKIDRQRVYYVDRQS